MKHSNLLSILSIFLVLTVVTVLPAAAGEGNIEIFFGGTDLDVPSATGVAGLRGGYRFSDSFGLQGSLSKVEFLQFDFLASSYDSNITYFDVSAVWYVNPGSRAEVSIYGGPGIAFFDLDSRHGGLIFSVVDDTTFHAGIGLDIRLSRHLYLRPDVKARWIDGLDNGVEGTLGIGWRFGSRRKSAPASP